MSYNILITSIGGIRGRDLALKLKSSLNDSKVYTGDKIFQDNMEYFSDGFFILENTKKKKKYISRIKDIIKKNKIKLIIPGSDEEAVLMSEFKEEILKFGSKVAVVDYQVLKKFKNKYSTYLNLTKQGLYPIRWEKINNKRELILKTKNFLSKLKEAVIKPVNSRGGRDISIVTNQKIKTKYFNDKKEIIISKKNFINKYIKIYKDKYPLIIMEKLYGTPFDADILCWKGKLIKSVVRQRIGYQGMHGNIVMKFNKKFETYLKKIVKCFNLSWLYDCDLMLDQKNNPVLIELNPRMSGSVSSSIAVKNFLISDLINLSKNKINLIKKNKIKKNKVVIAYNTLKIKK